MSVAPDVESELGDGPVAGASSATGTRRFAWALAGMVALGLLCRLLFIAGWAWGAPLHGDPLFFQQSAAHLAQGNGYVDQFVGRGRLVPTAEHPPAFSFLLAGLDLVHIRSVDAHRLALAFLSSLGVLVMGLLGRRLGGPGVGFLAAFLAAVDPLWVQWGGFVMSESLYLIVVPTMLLFALRCLDRPNRWDFLALGLFVGLATLTRSEAVDFVLVLGGLVLLLATRTWRDRLIFAVVFLAGVGLLVVPWIVRNDLQLHDLTLSTNGGLTLSGSYSDGNVSPSSPYYGAFDNDSQFGGAAYILKYGKPPDGARHWTESTLSNALGSGAITYARQHLSDLPGLVLAREGRLWGVYAPSAELAFDTAEDGTGAAGPKQAEQIVWWVLVPFAIIGGVCLGRRSGRRLLIVLVPVVVVGLNAAAFYGSTRLRVVAEPSVDVLAAFGALWFGSWIGQYRYGSDRSAAPALTSGEQPSRGG